MAKRSSESRVARVAKRRKPVKPTPMVTFVQGKHNRRMRLLALQDKERVEMPGISIFNLRLSQMLGSYKRWNVEFLGSEGLVRLPALRDPPPFLDDLFDHSKGGLHEHFRSNIRTYNSLIQFTSLGGKIDSSINDGSFPFIFRVNNQTHHRIGPLLPPQGRHPTFSQLYIYDTQNELANRMSAIAANDN
ncbi:hypothetical protein COLO4_32055 [Corchorus olitorius]|uniref:Uncharacterized protein n=1 Tax=Corchorus olitorius TaxID=93759 RepID=A0A1R3H244_9ROSI|nr:hypothetical protein COLO4_32055 [Corchorus olitorius]